MNICQNCHEALNTGISLYRDGQTRILCSWPCVEEFAQKAQENEGFWPPPIKSKKAPDQVKK